MHKLKKNINSPEKTSPAVAVVHCEGGYITESKINIEEDLKSGYPDEFNTSNNPLISDLKKRADYLVDNFELPGRKNIYNDNGLPIPDIEDNYSSTIGAGTHAEIHAVSEAICNNNLTSKEDLYKLTIVVIDKQAKPFATCPHCSFILGDYMSFSKEHEVYNKYVSEGQKGFDVYKKLGYLKNEYTIISNEMAKEENEKFSESLKKYIEHQLEKFQVK